MSKSFKRSRKDSWIGGVCGGMAEYFGIDALLTRILFILFSEALLPIYLIIWFLCDEE